MSRIFYYIRAIIFIMALFAIGFFLYGFFVLRSQTVPAEAETAAATNYVTLAPAIVSFMQGPDVAIPVEAEILTSLNVYYAVHGTPVAQYVSAYDIRDKALLWRHSISGGVIAGIALRADGSLDVCGLLQNTVETPFCLTLADDGAYPIDGAIAVASLEEYIAMQEVEAKLQADIIATEALRTEKELARIKTEQSIQYALQQDETHKASTTTLSDFFAAHSVAVDNVYAATNARVATDTEDVLRCGYNTSGMVADTRCVADLSGQAQISADFFPFENGLIMKDEDIVTESIVTKKTSISDLEDLVTQKLLATTTAEVPEVRANLPIEGADGIFDYDDVVDYRTCFHMCYYVEGSSWKKCTTGCNDKF